MKKLVYKIRFVFPLVWVLLIFTLVGCKPADKLKPNAPTIVNTPITVIETSETLILEQEKNVILHSIWNSAVRDAINEDPTSDINAVYLDLETGNLGKSNEADIRYALSCGSACFPIVTRAGGQSAGGDIEVFGQSTPTLADCYNLISNTKHDHSYLFSTWYGDYSCIKTEEGRYGWIRFDTDFRSGLALGDIQITYWLWTIPPESEK